MIINATATTIIAVVTVIATRRCLIFCHHDSNLTSITCSLLCYIPLPEYSRQSITVHRTKPISSPIWGLSEPYHHLMIVLANSEMSMILSLSLQSFQLENPIRQHYLNVVLPLASLQTALPLEIGLKESTSLNLDN